MAFSYGWKRQGFDPRDNFYLIPNDAPDPMLTVDLTTSMGPKLDQGRLGSCGPNTAAEAIGFDQKAEGLPEAIPSRLFIYWFTRYLMGTVNQDSGVDNRSMMKAQANYGWVAEADWPYDDTLAALRVKPPADVVNKASVNKLTDYASVVQSLTQMRGVLAAGRPFCLGFTVYKQIESDQAAETGVITDPTAFSTPVGGHDVLVVGHNATGSDLPGVKRGNVWPSGFFKVRNHWKNPDGSWWGDDGYGYVSFNYAANPEQAGDFWVWNKVPGGGVTPPPPPLPSGIGFDQTWAAVKGAADAYAASRPHELGKQIVLGCEPSLEAALRKLYGK